ncbi:MAG: hypothetical protein AAFQ63_03000 [Cyanobacteria bacterium J06621_11]
MDTQLIVELNDLVIEAHRQYEAEGNWPESLSDRASKACAEE